MVSRRSIESFPRSYAALLMILHEGRVTKALTEADFDHLLDVVKSYLLNRVHTGRRLKHDHQRTV